MEQFWLKERSEKRKALAAATPAVAQPKKTTQLGILASFRAHWKLAALSVVNFLFIQLLAWAFLRQGPVTHHEVVILIVASIIWIMGFLAYITGT